MTDGKAGDEAVLDDEVAHATLASDLAGVEAVAEIAEAVDGRRGVARRYVL